MAMPLKSKAPRLPSLNGVDTAPEPFVENVQPTANSAWTSMPWHAV
jgi:hypothetical protein